jgi:membrane protein insertase Oxa1/YidC/SpoIIIJ
MPETELKNWKLKNPCLDCEKDWRHNFCFEHRWENPCKLEKDKKEEEDYWKKQKSNLNWGFFWLIFVIVFNLALLFYYPLLIPGWWSLAPMFLNLICICLLFLWLIDWIKDFKRIKQEVQKELKKIKTKQEEWIKV